MEILIGLPQCSDSIVPETLLPSVKKLIGPNHFQHREGHNGRQEQQSDQIYQIEPQKNPPGKSSENIPGNDQRQKKIE